MQLLLASSDVCIQMDSEVDSLLVIHTPYHTLFAYTTNTGRTVNRALQISQDVGP